MTEVESCPRCGALPCDWTDNPHPQPTGDVGALAGRLWKYEHRFLNEAHGEPVGEAIRAAMCHLLDQAATILALTAEVERKDAALREIEDHETDRPCRTAEESYVYLIEEVRAIARAAIGKADQ